MWDCWQVGPFEQADGQEQDAASSFLQGTLGLTTQVYELRLESLTRQGGLRVAVRVTASHLSVVLLGKFK